MGDPIRFADSRDFAENPGCVAFHLKMKPIPLLCLALLTTSLVGNPEKLSAIDVAISV